MRGKGKQGRKWGLALAVLSLLASACSRRPSDMNTEFSGLSLSPSDRILIAAPHPDDETLACAGIIQKAAALKIPVRVVFLTNGDNNEWSFLLYRKRPVLASVQVRGMGEVRQKEALAAAAVLGLSPDHLVFLGYPDFGCLKILLDHWGDRPPFRSMLTRVTEVPYARSLRPGASYTGESILKDLTEVLKEFRPTKLFFPQGADHNVDHQAMHLFLRVALWDLEGEIAPEIFPYLVHYRRYPSPRDYHPGEELSPPRPLAGAFPWARSDLPAAEVMTKLQALQCHRTQYLASSRYLLSFVRPDEIFGDFPALSLEPSAPGPALPAEDDPEGAPGSEELTAEERSFFVGIEKRSIAREGEDIVFSLSLSRPLSGAMKASVVVLGYRPDRPFAAMPKVRVVCGQADSAAFDTGRPLPPGAWAIEKEPRLIRLRLPLKTLGDPDRIFAGFRTYLEEVPLDSPSWRILYLPPGEGDMDME